MRYFSDIENLIPNSKPYVETWALGACEMGPTNEVSLVPADAPVLIIGAGEWFCYCPAVCGLWSALSYCRC